MRVPLSCGVGLLLCVPLPATGQDMSPPTLAVASYGFDAGGWRIDRHPRLLADVNGDGRADIVGFGNAGAYVSLGQVNGTFSAPVLAVANYGYDAGGWRVDRHPRLLGDVNGDGRADIVGFGNAGAYVSLGQANGQFTGPVLAVANYGAEAGGWQVGLHPRLLGDVNGDGRADIVGFGNAGAYVSLGQTNGTFSNPVLAVGNYGAVAGGWRVDRHPRFLSDVNGDGRADIVGFGNAGAYVSLGQANGTFSAPVLAVASYGYDAGGWRVEFHPRVTANVNGDGRADIVGFGNAGAYVSLSGQATPHNLNVSRFTTTPLTNADADRILGDATTVLRTADDAADVACNVTFSRAGNVGAFNTGNGNINSQADFNAIIALPGDVKVVNAINWCGTPGVGIIGCAPVPGGSLTAVRFTANLEGILWAHEFGHNQGLSHRNGNNFVMNPFIGATARGVNAAECASYRNPTPAMPEALVVVSAAEHGDEVRSTTIGAGTVQSEQNIEEFVRRFYAHGVPYNEARRFGTSAVPRLLQMLEDPNQKPYWANIVGVLGIVGDQAVVQVLIDFIEGNRGKALDPETYRASLSAIVALGYLTNRTGDERALSYLGTAARGMMATSPATTGADAGELRLDSASVGQTAVLGLSLSGRPQAREILEELMRADAARLGASPTDSPTNAPSQNLLSDALTTLRTVQEHGLSEYYRREGQ
jgi:hypothetical protein